METMQFHITKMDLILRNIFFVFKWPNWTIRNAPSGSIYVLLPHGVLVYRILPSFLSIHEYANEIFFETNHKMKHFINCITNDLKTCINGGLMMV